jgi:S-adenosylmethionine:tRNA ribosyltransferase-isomerase
MSLDQLAEFDYAFPKDRIATAPASPRDSSRLLVCQRNVGPVAETTFRRLADHLPAGALLVFNRTKVVPARIEVRRATGGRVRLLITGTERGKVLALADRRLRAEEKLVVSSRIGFTVVGPVGHQYALRPSFPLTSLEKVLDRYGLTPLPPYMKTSPLTEKARRAKYQSVFADRRGSVAAPTASLHFTTRLLAELSRRGFKSVFVTLHVGLGTFAPLTEEQLRTGKLHSERFEIDDGAASAIDRARREGRPVIAVGTTALRALESAADVRGRVRKSSGETMLFIRPGYRFRAVDGLITNFHVPRSSLLMLVSALGGKTAIKECYRLAIADGYRLFSFGDAMLII